MKSKLLSFVLFWVCFQVSAQKIDSLRNNFYQYVRMVDRFSNCFPQEKVYLHFDNTCYYQNDKIWFKCYVVTSELNHATQLSKTLYVELLNPGGEIVDQCILKIENGECHGDFTLTKLPFYSGFYEVRAYTKYMLNFGEDAIFTRLLPVFSKPKVEGDYQEKIIRKYSSGKYLQKRVKPQKGKKINIKFYPEGGNLVQGINSRVAFEVTDAYGNPLNISGSIINEEKEEIANFSVFHDGKGVFTYTPDSDSEPYKAIINYNNQIYKFTMPTALPQGIVFRVDNLSNTDSINITLQKNKNTSSEIIGMIVISRGKPSGFKLINISSNDPIRFQIDKTKLPAGISQIVLFDRNGKIISSRFIFVGKEDSFYICSKTEKAEYKPYEKVNMKFAVTDKENSPIQTTFSLSIRDDTDGITTNQNILTNLLLMSEIKGYICNPSYYFESDDIIHRTALDQLLMVQGWSRYSWEQMIGEENFDLKFKPEQAIEVSGQVVSLSRKIPMSGVNVFSILYRKDENGKVIGFSNNFVTDSLGHFSFREDITGKWDWLLGVTKKGKRKWCRILLDRIFSPIPRSYEYKEMQVNLSEEVEPIIDEEKVVSAFSDEDLQLLYSTYTDSLIQAGSIEKIHHLKEVIVTAKKKSRERDIFQCRSESIILYDVSSELDNITDNGEYIGDNIDSFLLNLNKNFTSNSAGYLMYKGKSPLFIVDYERTKNNFMDYNKYKALKLDNVKSIYINEDPFILAQYLDSGLNFITALNFYSCGVFIETYRQGTKPLSTNPGKGIRKTYLNGYDQPHEFYQSDYSSFPQEADYRRTLYWNPSVITDKDGTAEIQFYNNSRCRKFKVSAETITPNGKIGISGN